MATTLARTLAALSFGIATAAFATPDKPGCTDPALFPVRMPDYHIADCKSAPFEAYDFRLPKGQKNRQEGKFTFVTYALERGRPEPSAVAILRNYENAFTAIGGTIAATLANNWVNGSVVLDGREVWAEIWPEIGPRIEQVMATGQATWDEGLRLVLERSGFPEETYHTFSYSPVPDGHGGIGGMLCVVTEETERILSERRLAFLHSSSAALALMSILLTT